jgi:predicted outer membrane protein
MKVLSQGHDDGVTIDMGSILTPEMMRQQVKDTLDKQFDEAYARRDKKTMQTASKLKGMMRK